MYRRSPFLLLAALLWAGCASSDVATRTDVDQAAPARSERPLPYPPDVPANFTAQYGDTRTEDGRPGPNYWAQEADYDMTVRLLPEDKSLQGQATITYHNNSPDRLDRIHMELAQNLHREGAIRNEFAEVTGGVQLEHISLGGRELPPCENERPCYLVEGTQLVLLPNAFIDPGTTAEIETTWSFKVPQAGAGQRMGYSEDNLFYLAYWYPFVSVYDDVTGWSTDQFAGNAEFYAEFGDYDVTVEAPAGWIVMGTGSLDNADDVLAPEVATRMRQAHQSDTPVVVVSPDDFGRATAQAGPNSFLEWHFTADQVRDFAFTAVRESIWTAARTPVGDRDGDGDTDYTHINSFHRTEAPLWDDVVRYEQHAISFLSDYSGIPYPWPHMTAVEGGGIIGGGMEYPMMTLIGDYNVRGDSALYYVTAHELAHMWVPMIVNTNERRYSWIDEGITTFHENVARMDFYPGSHPFQMEEESYLQVARAGLEGPMMRYSDYHYPGPAYVTASYPKPAATLWALQGVLGEQTFHRALKTFLTTWAYKHPYPYDLFNTFERVSGRDLDWFWRAWYYETWTLDQAVADVHATDGRTEIVVEDLGLVPMPVHLHITLANGETIDRQVPVDAWLRGATATSITLDTAAPVTRVEIDADRYFPDIDRSNNVWTR